MSEQIDFNQLIKDVKTDKHKDRDAATWGNMLHAAISRAWEAWRKHGLTGACMIYNKEGSNCLVLSEEWFPKVLREREGLGLSIEDYKPQGLAAELANVMILLAEWCGVLGIEIQQGRPSEARETVDKVLFDLQGVASSMGKCETPRMAEVVQRWTTGLCNSYDIPLDNAIPMVLAYRKAVEG